LYSDNMDVLTLMKFANLFKINNGYCFICHCSIKLVNEWTWILIKSHVPGYWHIFVHDLQKLKKILFRDIFGFFDKRDGLGGINRRLFLGWSAKIFASTLFLPSHPCWLCKLRKRLINHLSAFDIDYLSRGQILERSLRSR
jgi:hypothetical protein